MLSATSALPIVVVSRPEKLCLLGYNAVQCTENHTFQKNNLYLQGWKQTRIKLKAYNQKDFRCSFLKPKSEPIQNNTKHLTFFKKKLLCSTGAAPGQNLVIKFGYKML
jgi:hypothetical protein